MGEIQGYEMAGPEPSMSKRDRVLAAMDLQETDRTPIYDILVNDAAIEYLAGKYPPVGEEGLKLRLQATAEIPDMTRMVTFAPQEPGESVSSDGFGIRRRPFSDEEGAKC